MDEPRDPATQLQRERRATKGIGWLLLALASATPTAAGALIQLVGKSHPVTTLPGLAVSLLSISFMSILWAEKPQAGKALESGAVLADAACSLACIQLLTVLFGGSLAYLLCPRLWWLDGASALVLSTFIGREGLGTVIAASRANDQGGCGCH